MSNTDDIRWQQRFENLQKALADLDSACQREHYSTLERAGLIKLFEICFELTWKTLKDLLFFEGIEANSPRASIQESEVLLDVLKKRNVLTHTYNEATALEAIDFIQKQCLMALQVLQKTLREKQ